MIDLPESGRVGGEASQGRGLLLGAGHHLSIQEKQRASVRQEEASQATAGGQTDKGSRRWSSLPEADRSWEIMLGRTKAKTKEGGRCIYAAGNGKCQEVF